MHHVPSFALLFAAVASTTALAHPAVPRAAGHPATPTPTAAPALSIPSAPVWFAAEPVPAPLALPIASGQIMNPADKHPQTTASGESTQGHSWEVPETVVVPNRGEYFREEDRIGDYGQPRWTARRLFPSTRTYVRPAGQIEFEHWTRVKVPRNGGKSTVENQYELEIGLGHRWQFDLYFVTEKGGSEGEIETTEQKYEVRYALADWGKIPLNPTLYLEWVERSAQSDKIEAKLLLADEIAPGWHFGSNLVFEHELGGAIENEYELTLGVAHTIVDEKFSMGVETKAALVDEHSDRGDFSKELEIGPTFQFRPTPQMHIDFAPLIGIGNDSRAADIYLVLGWEF